ncbi:MAG: DNA repair protein RecO [Eubacterium sp.]|nr:DNA repair protein RecO [Eubacterium sp.]
MIETTTEIGIVLSAMPISEYDKRLVILTKDFGKITAFARGARKQNSKLLAGSQPMSFGEFTLYRGRNAYTLTDVKVQEYFSSSFTDVEEMYLGMYFLELSSYYGREGIEASETIKLLYVALKALQARKIPKELVRLIFELRTLAINGEYPNLFQCGNCGRQEDLDYYDKTRRILLCRQCHGKVKEILDASTVYALQYILTAKPEQLFHFTVTETVLKQMEEVVHSYMKQQIDKTFKSLEFFENPIL